MSSLPLTSDEQPGSLSDTEAILRDLIALDPWLTKPQAARYANATKADGTPTDDFYNTVKRHYPNRKRLKKSEIDRLLERGLL